MFLKWEILLSDSKYSLAEFTLACVYAYLCDENLLSIMQWWCMCSTWMFKDPPATNAYFRNGMFLMTLVLVGWSLVFVFFMARGSTICRLQTDFVEDKDIVMKSAIFLAELFAIGKG